MMENKWHHSNSYLLRKNDGNIKLSRPKRCKKATREEGGEGIHQTTHTPMWVDNSDRPRVKSWLERYPIKIKWLWVATVNISAVFPWRACWRILREKFHGHGQNSSEFQKSALAWGGFSLLQNRVNAQNVWCKQICGINSDVASSLSPFPRCLHTACNMANASWRAGTFTTVPVESNQSVAYTPSSSDEVML